VQQGNSLLQRSSVSVPDDIEKDLKENVLVDENSGNGSVDATVNAVIGGILKKENNFQREHGRNANGECGHRGYSKKGE
jgi:hypothetical protein